MLICFFHFERNSRVIRAQKYKSCGVGFLKQIAEWWSSKRETTQTDPDQVCLVLVPGSRTARRLRAGLGLSRRKRILPTKPKISRLITRRLIECRSSCALSANSFSSRSGLASPRPRRLFCSPQSDDHHLRSSTSRHCFHLVRPREPVSKQATTVASRVSFPPFRVASLGPFFPRPPALIHIHASVIVCRLAAGGHYFYTSCARFSPPRATASLFSSYDARQKNCNTSRSRERNVSRFLDQPTFQSLNGLDLSIRIAYYSL